MTLPARYSGTCPECEEAWQPGDLIRSGDWGEDGVTSTWVHAVCPDAPTATTHPVCQTCWLTHPEGACDR